MRLRFEQGTLLLDASRCEGSAGIAGLRWDPRSECFRAPAYRYAALRSELRSCGWAVVDQVLRPRAAIGAWRSVSLRPYQQAALLAWQRERGGVLVMPTGSGKTRVACAAMAVSALPALCIVPTRALMHQWASAIAEFYVGPVGLLGDGQRQLEAVTVATFESAHRMMPRIGDRFGLLVVDEVHHFGAGVRDEALELCAAPRRLALTATPPDGESLWRLQELIGPCVCELRIGDLVGSWLADFDNVVLRVRLDARERAEYEGAVRVFRDGYQRFRALAPLGQWREFVALAGRSEEGRRALAAFRVSRRITHYPSAKRRALAAVLAQHRGQRCLVFTPDNATAYAIAREQLIMPITCDIPRRERDAALAAFRAGELLVLVSAQVLNEGLDVPDAEVAIIVGGVRGQREHVQRVGRLLRPAAGKRAVVYELVVEGTHETRSAKLRRRALQQAERRHG